jgi:AcrR family transcriptional regulator
VPSSSARTLSTAEQRREEVLVAAERAFAARGYHGTPTTEIAKAAGISQAYLFRLFPTKLELFTTLVERCFARTGQAFTRAAEQALAQDADALLAMGRAYSDLLTDRERLLLQLQAYAAADEPAIRDATRAGFGELYELVGRLSGADADTLRNWFGIGMLLNVLAAMGVDKDTTPWAAHLVPPRS